MTSSATTHTSLHARDVVMTDACTGRKGPSYDWQTLLIPSDTVFEASLQMMLATPAVRSEEHTSELQSH